jgi:hypothetical protein
LKWNGERILKKEEEKGEMKGGKGVRCEDMKFQ